MQDTPPITQPIPNQPAASQVRQASDAELRPDMNETVANASLRSRLDQIVRDNESKGITTSVSVKALRKGNNVYSHNVSAKQFAASVNKLPVSLLLLEDLRSGRVNLDTRVTWQASDVRGGFGQLDQPGAPTTASVRDLIFDMLNYSGNTAVRVLVNYQLGGPQAVNDRLAAYPQLATTRLTVLTPTTFFLGDSTSAESQWIIEQLLGREDRYQRFIKNALVTNIFSYYGVRSQLESQDFIVLANKVGILDDPEGNNRHDVGIIYNTKDGKSYSYSFMTTTPGGQTANTAHAEHSLDLLGRQVLRYAGDKPDNRPYSASPNARDAAPEVRVRY